MTFLTFLLELIQVTACKSYQIMNRLASVEFSLPMFNAMLSFQEE